MPGVRGGGGGQTGGGGGGGSYAGGLLDTMYNSGGGGWGSNRSKYSFGNPPPERSPALYDMQMKCSSGDGKACAQLAVMEQQYQYQVEAYHAREKQEQQRYSDTHKKSPSMGAYRGR